MLEISYLDGRGILREVLVTCTREAFAVSGVRVERTTETEAQAGEGVEESGANLTQERIVTVYREVHGLPAIAGLAAELSHIKGVVSVKAGEGNVASE